MPDIDPAFDISFPALLRLQQAPNARHPMKTRYILLMCFGICQTATAQDVSCAGGSKARQIICATPSLHAAQERVDGIYRQAFTKASSSDRLLLARKRDEWNSDASACGEKADAPACMSRAFEDQAIALQTSYRLVRSEVPLMFSCADGRAIVVTKFHTVPSSMVARSAGAVATLRQSMNGVDGRYEDGASSAVVHGKTAVVIWRKTKPTACTIGR